jgi:hypothetical protein
MATPLVVGDVWKMVAACNNTNQVAFNTVYFNITAVGASPATDADMALSLDQTVAPNYKAIMGSTSSYYGVKVTRISPIGLIPSPVVSATLTGVGTVGVGCLPGQTCGVMRLTTGLLGKKNRGRLFLPFPQPSLNDNVLNTPTAAYVTACGALGVNYSQNSFIVIAGRTATLTPVLYHRSTRTFTPITGFFVPKLWGTQHRRGNYGRANIYPPF